MKNVKLKILSSILMLSSAVLLLASCAYFNTYYNAKKFYEEGVKENENNTSGRPQTANFQKSINSAARVIEYYPDSKYVDDAILIMAKGYYEIQSYPKAKRKCDELIANYPESPLVWEGHLYLGKTFIAMRRPDEGIPVLNNLWLNDKASDEIRLQSQRTLADYYFEKENYRQALLEYEKILQTMKNKRQRANVRYQIGECYFEMEDYQQAEAAYERVLHEKPSTKTKFDAMLKRSVCFRYLGDLEGALKICEKLLKKDIFYDFFAQANLAKASIQADLGYQDEAVELYERILELYPRTETSAEASYHLGYIYWKQLHNFEKAQEYFGKVRSEKAQSEFVEESEERATDLRKFQALNRGIDSLHIDLDTLAYQLEWLAEKYAQMLLDTTQKDTTLEAESDSTIADTLIEPVVPSPYGPGSMGPGGPQDLQSSKSGSGTSPYGPASPPQPSVLNRPGGPGGPGSPGGPQEQRAIRIVPLPEDSTTVYLRMEEDRQELAEFRFRLAEHFWTRLENLDSALVILDDLANNEENPDVRARTLLTLHYLLSKTSPDSMGPDSLLQLVHDNFLETDYDRWVRSQLGLEPLPEPIDTVLVAFREAEELWITDEEPDSAVTKYRELVEKWPESDLAPKALYASAWLQEWLLENIDAASASYDSLIAWYPESEYVQIAQNKLAPPPPDEPDSLEVLDDSTMALIARGELGEAPPGTGSVLLLGGEDAVTNYIYQNHLYPMVAEEAELPGEALISFIVEANGTPKEFRIEREEPEGFDFGENAILTLRGMKFRPAYENGQYIESPTEQIVRFIP